MAYISFQPSDYFNTKLYTGTGSAQSISSVGFQPDWVWVKDRDSANSHNLTDAVRGATKTIFSDATAGEVTDAQRLTSFDSDGFSVGTSTSFNTNTNDYVSWNWKANGSGSSNTDGSITSTVSANTTAGFSIVTYTGTGSAATVGHGLGSAPSVIIQKKTSASATWLVKHPGIGTNGYIRLDATNTSATDSAIWNSTDPTSTVFSIGTDATINGSGATSVAYCFAEKTGFSKFGSYTGNGNADGSFIYTGFAPSFLLFKNASVATSWVMHDTKRDTFNISGKGLFPNETSAESSTAGRELDILSNGFKIRNSNGEKNTSGNTYIYMAFAEAPLVGSNNVPCTAR